MIYLVVLVWAFRVLVWEDTGCRAFYFERCTVLHVVLIAVAQVCLQAGGIWSCF